jgi:hypothetical protein
VALARAFGVDVLTGVEVAEAGVAEVLPPLRMLLRRWETALGVQSGYVLVSKKEKTWRVP